MKLEMDLPVAKPLLGIQVPDAGPDAVVEAIRTLGIELTFAHLEWGAIEPRLGQRDWSRLDLWPAVEAVVGQLPERIWTLYPVHMNARGPLPEELRQVAFGSREMRHAFESFVAAASERARWDQGRPIAVIGNEVDSFADAHPDQIDEVAEFLRWAADTVRRHAPSARVCHPFTADAVEKPGGPALMDRITDNADILGFTCYGLGNDQRVADRSLESVYAGLERFAAGRQIVIVEIARPSGAASGSSEELQAAHVDELFDLLGSRSRDQLEGAVWLTIDDWPVDPMREFIKAQFAGFDGNEAFLSFLTSNGIRDVVGRPKQAAARWMARSAEYRAVVAKD